MIDSDFVKKIYKKNYITRTIYRIDFPAFPEYKKDDYESHTKFQEKIKEKYPNIKQNKKETIEVNMSKDSQNIISVTEPIWIFNNDDKSKLLNLEPDNISITETKYTTFDSYYEDIKFVLDAFIDLYPIKEISRIGMRYINEIKFPTGDPLDWSGYIDPNLFSIAKNFPSETDKVLRSMHLLALKEETYKLNFQFGCYNSEFPNPVTRKEFVLDYDCRIKEQKNISDAYQIAKDFNKIINYWFEKSIGDELRRDMEVVVNGEE